MRRVLKSFMKLFMVTSIVASSITAPLLASDAGPMKLDSLEAKFMVDSSKIVDGDTNDLTQEAKELFGIVESTDIIVSYIDTDEKTFNADGWSNRLRKKDGKKNNEIQYKKRYPIVDGDIDSALLEAAKDGFTEDLVGYEAEVDWGFNKMTLSIATETKIKTTEGLFLPDEDTGVELVKTNSPKELSHISYEGARYHGPVKFTRHTGEFMGVEIDVEVWSIISEDRTGTEVITEVSFKGTDFDDVANTRELLKGFLKDKDILLEKDSLKTQLILDRY